MQKYIFKANLNETINSMGGNAMNLSFTALGNAEIRCEKRNLRIYFNKKTVLI